jgi:hypothetical protein
VLANRGVLRQFWTFVRFWTSVRFASSCVQNYAGPKTVPAPSYSLDLPAQTQHHSTTGAGNRTGAQCEERLGLTCSVLARQHLQRRVVVRQCGCHTVHIKNL